MGTPTQPSWSVDAHEKAASVGGPHSTWSVYGEAFRQAGNRLVEDFQSGEMPSRFHEPREQFLEIPEVGYLGSGFVGYPVLYLYRHAIELGLKDVLRAASRRLDHDVALKPSHDLNRMWRAVRSAVEEAWPRSYSDLLDRIGSLIGEFHAFDPSGESFRYPSLKKGQPSLPKPALLDLSRVRDVVAGITEFLRGATYGMDIESDLRAEMNAELMADL